MPSCKIVSSIFLARDKLLWVEKLAVATRSNFINDSWFKINKHSSGHMPASTGFTEECIEGIMGYTYCIVTARTPKFSKVVIVFN